MKIFNIDMRNRRVITVKNSKKQQKTEKKESKNANLNKSKIQKVGHIERKEGKLHNPSPVHPALSCLA